MSLVSEALRKARAEAAEREGRRHGVPRALALPPKRSRSGPGLALLLVIVLAAAIAGAAIAWWAFARHPSPAGAEARAVARATPAPEAATHHVPVTPAAVPVTTTTPGLAPPPTALSKTGREHTVASVPTTPPILAAAGTPSIPVHGEPGASSGRDAVPAEPSGPGKERSFAIDANLGYAKLHLDFIVYRPGSPFAGINGSQVIVGSVIEGFTVEEIGPESVRLHDRHGTVVLRVR